MNLAGGDIPLILEHILSTLLIEIGLGAVAWVGHLILPEGLAQTLLISVDEWAMLGVSIWLIRNLAVHLWNNREKVNGINVVLA